MLSLINKNICLRIVSYIVSCFLFIIFVVPIISILIEIIYETGTILGSFIRSYSIC